MTADKPVLGRSPAPDHASDFWATLNTKLRQQEEREHGETGETTEAVAQLPRVEAADARRRSGARVLAMAASVIVVIAMGVFLLARSSNGDRTTELVVEAESSVTPASAAQQVPASQPAERVPIDDAPAVQPTSLPVVEGSATQAAGATPTPGPDDASMVASELPVAAGTVLDTAPVYLPSPAASFGRLPTTFLGTWADQRLSWFEWVDDAEPCTSHRHSGIGYVNEAGIALTVNDWGRTFSGAISHFTPSDDFRQVAWLVSCATQLEVYVAQLSSTPGELTDVRLAWVGEGSSTPAFMLWDGPTVSLNTVDVQGQPFFVDIDAASRSVTDSARVDDFAAPIDGDAMVVGATATGSFTYWNGTASENQPSCDTTGNTLWVRSSQDEWRQAVTDVPVSSVVAFDVDSIWSLAAFADACDGVNAARVMVGTLRADGLISSVRVIDLGAFATGSVSELFWVEPNLLRIHTDNTEFGGEILRFDYIFDEGRDGGILQQLDG